MGKCRNDFTRPKGIVLTFGKHHFSNFIRPVHVYYYETHMIITNEYYYIPYPKSGSIIYIIYSKHNVKFKVKTD